MLIYVTKDAGEYAGQVNPECHLQKHHPLPRPGTHHLGEDGWPVSSRNPSVCLPGTGLQKHVLPTFSFCFNVGLEFRFSSLQGEHFTNRHLLSQPLFGLEKVTLFYAYNLGLFCI